MLGGFIKSKEKKLVTAVIKEIFPYSAGDSKLVITFTVDIASSI
jgi:hypothetical protein